MKFCGLFNLSDSGQQIPTQFEEDVRIELLATSSKKVCELNLQISGTHSANLHRTNMWKNS